MTLKIVDVEKSVSSVEESMSTEIAYVGESMSNKIAEVEKSILTMEGAMSTKISATST